MSLTPEQYAVVLERAADVLCYTDDATGYRNLREQQEEAAHLRALAKALRAAKEDRIRGVPPNDALVGFWIPIPQYE